MATDSTQNWYKKHQQTLADAINALKTRDFYTPYPEHPKAYAEEENQKGKDAFGRLLNLNFEVLNQKAEHWIGEEVSPFWQMGLGIHYPSISVNNCISNSNAAASEWAKTSIETRAGILIEVLDRLKARFFELAYATMHTAGQGFVMAFQASGPHSNDRALEAIAMGVEELTRFPKQQTWIKPMGKHNLSITKNWKPIPKGIGVVIGCSTFPTWNSVPGVFANLICGNTVIVKPHPKSILAIAIVVEELRKALIESGLDANVVQLAVDTLANPITKELAEHKEVSLLDYTGGNAFGDYIESLPKTTFTEKAGVNSIIIDSVEALKPVVQNIGFSVSLYSGQMCTAPQNVFIPEEVKTTDGILTFDEVADALVNAVKVVVEHPKMGANTLGSIQNDSTVERVSNATFKGEVALESMDVANEEFGNARILSPRVIKTTAQKLQDFEGECFGPIVFLVRTKDTAQSVELASRLAKQKGAITCGAYTTSKVAKQRIETEMNKAFTPVSFNFTGGIFVNQQAAFSDFHVTGGNPAGNASFTNPEYINKRFVWVGNRWM